MPNRTLIVVMLALVAATAALSGCGRRGDLEAPQASLAAEPAPPTADAGISPLDPGAPEAADEAAIIAPAAPPPPKRRFFLDFLL